MGKPKVKKSEETNRQFDSDTKCSSKQQVSIDLEDFFLGCFLLRLS